MIGCSTVVTCRSACGLSQRCQSSEMANKFFGNIKVPSHPHATFSLSQHWQLRGSPYSTSDWLVLVPFFSECGWENGVQVCEANTLEASAQNHANEDRVAHCILKHDSEYIKQASLSRSEVSVHGLTNKDQE